MGEGSLHPVERIEKAEALQRRIRARETLFDSCAMGFPAWKIMLDLYYNQLIKRDVSVGDACLASGQPKSTALRLLKALAAEASISFYPDKNDARRTLVSLTPAISERFDQYFDEFLT